MRTCQPASLLHHVIKFRARAPELNHRPPPARTSTSSACIYLISISHTSTCVPGKTITIYLHNISDSHARAQRQAAAHTTLWDVCSLKCRHALWLGAKPESAKKIARKCIRRTCALAQHARMKETRATKHIFCVCVYRRHPTNRNSKRATFPRAGLRAE